MSLVEAQGEERIVRVKPRDLRNNRNERLIYVEAEYVFDGVSLGIPPHSLQIIVPGRKRHEPLVNRLARSLFENVHVVIPWVADAAVNRSGGRCENRDGNLRLARSIVTDSDFCFS